MGDLLENYQCHCSAYFRRREDLATHLAEIQVNILRACCYNPNFPRSRNPTMLFNWRSALPMRKAPRDISAIVNVWTYVTYVLMKRAKQIRQHTRITRILHGTLGHVNVSLSTIWLLTDIVMTDVPCDEVCVFCCIRFGDTRKFLRHVAECHKLETGRKADFLRHTCTELEAVIGHELHIARHKRLPPEMTSTGKRTRVVSETSSVTLDTERTVKVRVMDKGYQIAQAANQLSSFGQATATITANSTGGGSSSVGIDAAMSMNSVNVNGFDDVASGLTYPVLEGDLDSCSIAPIFQIVSGPDSYWNNSL